MKDGPAGRIDAAASTVLILGVVSVALGAFQAIVPILLDKLAGSLDTGDDPTRPLREALAGGSGWSAGVNLAFGAAAIVAAVAVYRRAPFAHRAITALAWGSIAMLVAIAKPSLAPLVVLTGGGVAARAAVAALALLLFVAQVGAVLWFLRFWRKDEVRAAFRSG
ncbi:MAG TPA: hypothetical protein VFV19_13310 [Candidatus Polarisedimenticolaceae bacterium]|nr:hypothetical protein [Candidatus Polarisedimenticolaceae bacterium]